MHVVNIHRRVTTQWTMVKQQQDHSPFKRAQTHALMGHATQACSRAHFGCSVPFNGYRFQLLCSIANQHMFSNH